MGGNGNILIKNGIVVFEKETTKTDILVQNGIVKSFGKIKDDITV